MQEELYDEVWGLLHKVQHLLHRAREMELENDGLSTVAAGVLSFVDASKKPVTPSMLSRYLHRQPHTISGLVSRMENQGLVKKVKDLERKNQVHVTLTKKGKRLAQKLEKLLGNVVSHPFPCTGGGDDGRHFPRLISHDEAVPSYKINIASPYEKNRYFSRIAFR